MEAQKESETTSRLFYYFPLTNEGLHIVRLGRCCIWFESHFERIKQGFAVSSTLNVYTGQNPRRHVVFIEIQPNAYNNHLFQAAGVILTFFWGGLFLWILEL
jgi:hypothetical protein